MKKDVSRAENERDKARLEARRLERDLAELAETKRGGGMVSDLSLEELQERIHGLTLAYYYMKRKQPPVAPAPLLDHVNRYSLPGAPALKAIADGDVAS